MLRLALVAGVVAALAIPEASRGSEPVVPSPPHVLKVGDRGFSVGELESLLADDLRPQHFLAVLGKLDFDQLLEGRVTREMLLVEGKRQGLDREVEAGIFRFRRNFVIAKDFKAFGLTEQLRPTQEEIDAAIPQDLRTFTIRQIMLSTREEAEQAREELLAGAGFVAMIRERSVGPETRKDGLLWRYQAGDGLFPAEAERHLFALPLNAYSDVIDNGLGFVVARVEAAADPEPGYGERLRKEVTSAVTAKRVQEEIDRITGRQPYRVTPRTGLFPFVKAWQELGRISEEAIVEVDGEVIRFDEVVALSLQVPDHSLAPSLEERVEKLFGIARGLAVEHLLAREAEARGHALHPASEAELERRRDDAILQELHDREVGRRAAPTEEEARAFYEREIDRFSSPASVEVRHVLLDSEEEARELLGQLREGRDFEAAARSLSRDRVTGERGGLLGRIRRGQTVPEFEAAAFALREPLELSAPTRSEYGWHIIQLLVRRDEVRPPFDQVRSEVVRVMTAERSAVLEAEFLARVRERVPVTVDEEAMARLRERFTKERFKSGATAPVPGPGHGR